MNPTAAALATFGGVGRLPVAPGGWGALAALVVAALVVYVVGRPWGAWVLAAGTIALYPVGVWAAGRYAAATGEQDPGPVVIDEVVGQWLALLPLAFDWRYYPLAFVLFRAFDVVKPWPARRLERLPGGTGIMADDVAAGAYAGALAWLASLVIGATPNMPNLFG